MAKRSLQQRLAAVERELAEVRVRAVEAQEFRLVDKSGRVRAVLEVTRSGVPRLAMLNEEGAACVEITLGKDGPGVRLGDSDGDTRVFIGATKDAARIGLADADGNNRAFLGVMPKGGATLALYDAKQKVVWSAAE